LRRPGRAVGRWLFVLAALAYAAFAVDMVTRPIPWLVGFLPDDTFYYLQIARHLAASGRSTFDGINPTNGYHPAWMLVLTAWAAVLPGREGLLRAAVGTALVAHLATSALLVVLMRPLVGRWWAWIVGIAWLWSPLPLLLAIEAMEAPLSLLAVVVLALVYARRVLPAVRGLPAVRAGVPFVLSTRDLVTLGLALAFAVWARMDGFVLAAVALAFPVVAVARGSLRAGVDAAARLAVAAFTLVLAVVPWWVFSYGTVGTLAQDSAVMKVLWGRAQARTGAPLVARINDVVHGAVAGAVSYLSGDLSPLTATWEALGLVLVTVALLRVRGASARRLRRLLGVLGAGALILFIAYGWGAADLQSWYLGLPGLVLLLAALASLARLAGRAPLGFWLGLGVAVVAMVLGLRFWSAPFVPYPWQRDVLVSLPAFEARVPVEARVGAFNAGIPAYFGSRTVVNLDGLVNHAVVPYWRDRRFPDYVRDAHIEYVADEEGALRRARLFSSRDLPFREVGSVTLRGWTTGRRVLWRVEEAR
jgi:hypothetical protein